MTMTAKIQRPPGLEVMFYIDVLQSQQTDTVGNLADCLLVCVGGSIRAHAFLLQAASPVIQLAIQSQGENYPFMREILLPDFSLKEIERMLTLIYKGSVDLKNTKESQSLLDVLKFFQVSGVISSDEKKVDIIKGTLKVQELNRIPKDIFKQEPNEFAKGGSIAAFVEIIPAVSEGSGEEDKRRKMPPEANNHRQSPDTGTTEADISKRRSGRKRKAMKKNGKAAGSDDSDIEVLSLSGDESSDDTPHRREKPSLVNYKNQKELAKCRQPVLKLPRILPPSTIFASTSATPTISTVPTAIIGSKGTLQKSKPDDKEDSGTDEEDMGWVAPVYKNKEWFNRESRRCQYCDKMCDKPAEASLCITSHKSLRCYFCFKVYSTTDILFKHFRRRHKQAGRESSLICPFCELTIPYKSVSCHVISVHLRSKTEEEAKPTSVTNSTSTLNENLSGTKLVAENGGKSRSSSPSNRSPSKKLKSSSHEGSKKSKQLTLTEMKKSKEKASTSQHGDTLKVPDMDISLEKLTVRGKTIVFRLQKKRPTSITT
ncbi:Transcription factor Ken 2 [Orchesella cincta]|uniref:Transcription factor Ken 2 n=1 Tax=Orchesella cincta TaxID=48709 RepID=A0A1D2NF33_ORCCI|nr:Transcription factor Ken 2 [Orchesella cincta]